MKRALVLALVLACGGSVPKVNDPKVRRDATDRLQAAISIVKALGAELDSGIPTFVAKKARCVAIVPNLVHAGFLVGARGGNGVVSCRSPAGWTEPAFFTLSGASAGIQAGAETVDLVMLATTSATESSFLAGRFQLGASGSFAAGPIGRAAEIASDVTLAPVLFYSRSKGLFVGLDLGGTSSAPDEEATRAFYGDRRDLGVLLKGPHPVPPVAAAFQATLAEAFGVED